MLTPDSKIQCRNESRLLKDIRENTQIVGASGWSEVAETKVSDVFVDFEHKGPILTIATSRGSILKCSPEQTCFGRLNPMSRHYQLYLMERSTMGFRVGMSQELMRDLFANQNAKGENFTEGEIVDRVWIMETTESLPHAVFLEKFAMFKYGIPNLPFTGKQQISDMSDEMIRELYNRIDTPKRAKEMLADANMFEEFPHITMRLAKAGPQGSSAIQFVLFGGSERKSTSSGYSHLIRIDGAVQLNRAEHKQFKRRMNQRGLWHLEVTRDDLEEAQLFVKTLSCLDNLQVVQKIQLTKKAPFYILPASHLKVGMVVPVVGNRGVDEDTITSIVQSDFNGPLYHLKTENLFNYIAGEWIVMAYNRPSDADSGKGGEAK